MWRYICAISQLLLLLEFTYCEIGLQQRNEDAGRYIERERQIYITENSRIERAQILNDIVNELLKCRGDKPNQQLTTLIRNIFSRDRIPDERWTSIATLLFKNGD